MLLKKSDDSTRAKTNRRTKLFFYFLRNLSLVHLQKMEFNLSQLWKFSARRDHYGMLVFQIDLSTNFFEVTLDTKNTRFMIVIAQKFQSWEN